MEFRIVDDFTGFTFNGRHSSEFNIYRVSDGSRYNEFLTPSFQDVTQQMPGSDETLYWDSYYNNRTWTVSIAFDGVSETNLRELRNWLNAKACGELIFDEAPYKAYYAKVQSQVELKYICFDDYNTNGEKSARVYKGEGTVQFISYYPYARATGRYLTDFVTLTSEEPTDWETNRTSYYQFSNVAAESKFMVPARPDATWTSNAFYTDVPYNYNEWCYVCGMNKSRLRDSSAADTRDTAWDWQGVDTIHVYNAGDVPAEVEIEVAIDSDGLYLGWITMATDSSLSHFDVMMSFAPTMSALSTEDNRIRISSRTNLIEGVYTTDISSPAVIGKTTGTLYNKFLVSGDFFKLPLGESAIKFYKRNGEPLNASIVRYKHEYY